MGCVSKGKGIVMMLCQERVLRIAKLRARGLFLMTLSCCLHIVFKVTHPHPDTCSKMEKQK